MATKAALNKLLKGQDLTGDESAAVMETIATGGGAPPPMAAAAAPAPPMVRNVSSLKHSLGILPLKASFCRTLSAFAFAFAFDFCC